MRIKFFEMSELSGCIFKSVTKTIDEIIFTTDDGREFHLGHINECCEEVWLEDVVGDITDLENAIILVSEEVKNMDEPPPENRSVDDCYTWTYYNFRTLKGSVQVRFFGTSNGFYSETADLYEIL